MFQSFSKIYSEIKKKNFLKVFVKIYKIGYIKLLSRSFSKFSKISRKSFLNFPEMFLSQLYTYCQIDQIDESRINVGETRSV